MGIPVKYVGVGEQIDNLELFNPDQFVDALFDEG
jgi:fused signal recognition particle receptor